MIETRAYGPGRHNMHTPQEARATWCPMVRLAAADTKGTVVNGQSVANRLQVGAVGAIAVVTPDASNCIADKCAMWRWEHTTASVPVPGENGATCYEQRTVRTHGYCGLAPLNIT